MGELAKRLPKLGDTSSLLCRLFTLSPVAMQICTPDGQVLLTNEAHTRLFGATTAAAATVFGGAVGTDEALRDALGRACGGQSVELPAVWHDRPLPGGTDASPGRAVATLLLPLADDDGAVPYVLLASSDVSTAAGEERARQKLARLSEAQAALKESEARYRTIVETAQEGIWVIDPAGRTTFTNPRMAQMLGYTVEELYGRSMFDLLAPQERDLAAARLGRRNEGATEQHDSALIRKDGSMLVARMATSPLRDAEGRVTGALAMVTDVTERRLFEAEREQLLESERATRRMLQLVMDTIPQRLFWKDRDLKYLGANSAFARDAGFDSPEQLVGRDDTHLAWKEMAGRYQADDRQVMESQQPRVDFEESLMRADGQLRWLRTTKVPLRDGHGQVIGMFGSYTDVTDRRRDADGLALLQAAGDVVSGSLDEASTVASFARWAVSHFAQWCEVLVSRPDANLERVTVTHADAATLRELAARPSLWGPLLEGAAIVPARLTRLPDRFWPGDGALPDEARPHSALALPLTHQGERLGWLILAMGTQYRAFDDADLHLGMELSSRLATAMKNARLYADAQRSIQLREEFLSVASHELNTPLTPLMLRLQSLQRMTKSLGDKVPPQLAEATDVALRQTRRLAALVSELLDVSRLQSGRLSMLLDPVELGELVQEVIVRYEDALTETKCTVVIDAPREVTGRWDRARLERVVTNLLSNAMKYGPGKPIEISIRQERDEAVLAMSDHGIGIAPADLGRIFGRFERGVSERHYGGLGLGLFISRQIVERLGGTLEAQSPAGVGATFTVRLPLAGPSDDEATPRRT